MLLQVFHINTIKHLRTRDVNKVTPVWVDRTSMVGCIYLQVSGYVLFKVRACL